MQVLRRGREGYAGDERILGGSEFVERVRRESLEFSSHRTKNTEEVTKALDVASLPKTLL